MNTVIRGPFAKLGEGAVASRRCSAYTYVGQWEVVDFTAFNSTFEALVPGSTGGVLDISEDNSAALLAVGELDPAIAGFPLPVTMDYAGHASPVPGPGNVTWYFDGELDASVLVESSFAELDCAIALDGLVDCTGTVNALASTMRAEATFEPR